MEPSTTYVFPSTADNQDRAMQSPAIELENVCPITPPLKAFPPHIAKGHVRSASHGGVSFLHHPAAVPSPVASAAIGLLEDANSIAKGASQDVNSTTTAQPKPPFAGKTIGK